MTRRLALALAVSWLAAGLLMAPGWRRPAYAASETKSVKAQMATEAWYLQVLPCVGLIDCSPLPPVNPFPEDTLHVAVAGGQETARTYASFSFTVPSTASLTGGTMTLPVDTNPLHGSLLPDRAQMLACLVTEEFGSVRGSLATPPAIDCDVSAPAAWDEKRDVFTLDVRTFLAAWQGGEASVALVPASASRPSPDAWHVVFPATPKEGSKGPRITATITYTVGDSGSGGPSGIPIPDVPQVGGTGVGFGPLPQPPAPQPTVLPAAPAVQPLYPGGFAGLGFAYPIVWALPLVLLAGIGAIGRALTKELYRRSL
jgi:hypothetical protein